MVIEALEDFPINTLEQALPAHDRKLAYSLQKVHPKFRELFSNPGQILTTGTLYSSERCVIGTIQFDHVEHPVITKTVVPGFQYIGEEPINDIPTEYDLLNTLEGYQSFVLPYGLGQAIDLETYQVYPTMFMEYARGVSLDEALDMERDPVENIDWFNMISTNLCAAVDHQHAHGIINRDLSSTNIRIQDDQLKILDLGIAKRIQTRDQVLQITQKTSATGSIAPLEEFHGLVSIKTDMYAVGVHFLKWFMGTTDEDEILNAQSRIGTGKTTIPFSSHLTQLLDPNYLEKFWQKTATLLRTDPEERPDNLHGLRRAFSDTLSHSPQLIRARKQKYTL